MRFEIITKRHREEVTTLHTRVEGLEQQLAEQKPSHLLPILTRLEEQKRLAETAHAWFARVNGLPRPVDLESSASYTEHIIGLYQTYQALPKVIREPIVTDKKGGQQPDHPSLLAEGISFNEADADGTDFAHPAWWRGHDQTVAMMCEKLSLILDRKDFGADVANAPWEPVRRRLIAVVRELAEAKEEITKLQLAVLAGRMIRGDDPLGGPGTLGGNLDVKA